MKFYAGMTYNSQYDFWSVNFARMTEQNAQAELARLRGKGCDDIRLFVVEEIPARAAHQPTAAPLGWFECKECAGKGGSFDQGNEWWTCGDCHGLGGSTTDPTPAASG